MNLTVEQWLAVITFLGGIIFALMKFYHVFSQLEDSMKELKQAVLLLIQVVAVPFGYKFQIEMINKQLLDVVNALFVVLTILGIVTDPTTPGLSDRKGDK